MQICEYVHRFCGPFVIYFLFDTDKGTPCSFANCLVSRHVYNFDCTQNLFMRQMRHLKHFFLFVRYMQIAVVLVDVCESCGAIESIVGHS